VWVGGKIYKVRSGAMFGFLQAHMSVFKTVLWAI